MAPIFLKPKYWDWLNLSAIYISIYAITRPQEAAVFLLFILFMNITVLRLRFNYPSQHLLIDTIIAFMLSFYWQEALYLLLPVGYLMLRHKQWRFVFMPFALLLVYFYQDISVWLFTLVILILSGLINVWQDATSKSVATIDALRKTLYHTEKKHHDIIEEQQETTRIAVLTERDRIAQQLHDDLGHELTAGLLSLKAHQTLLNNDALDEDTLKEALKRFENATTQLKNTVHNTKPLETFGLKSFEQHIQNHSTPIDYKKSGDLESLNPHYWPILTQTLKEALTNILKHADAKTIDVELIKTDHVIRLVIVNDGIKDKPNHTSGMGLKYMRDRVESLGGSLSIQPQRNRFKLIVLIPLGGD